MINNESVVSEYRPVTTPGIVRWLGRARTCALVLCTTGLLAACTAPQLNDGGLDNSTTSGNTTSGDSSLDTGGLSIDELHRSPAESARTWNAAIVRLPTADGGIISTNTEALANGDVVPDGIYPVVIWLHGCSGFWSGTYRRADWLARNGFVVIAPLSPARSYYPRSCNTGTFESGLYRPTLIMRQFDAGYAIQQIPQFSWADQNNIFLMGYSEGAAVATTYQDRNNIQGLLKARVAEGWGCHAGWSEFVGINAPATEAVLSLVADRDPWYTSDFHQGDCGQFMNFENGSSSYVVNYAPLRYQHPLLDEPAIQEITLNFLLQQLIRN